MNRNFASPILIVLLALAVPVAARAQTADREPQSPGHMGMMGGMHAHAGMMAGLQLSDDQKSKLEDIHYRHMKRAIGMRADLKLASLDLQRLMRSETPDQRAIDAQIDRISAMRASLHKAGVASMFEARAILTPEQRKQWRPGMMMHGGMMRGGPGGGMHRGPRDGMMHGGPGGGMHEGMNGTQPDHEDEGDEN